MICVSVAEPTLDGCLRAIAGARLAEVRLDLARLSDAEVRQLFAQPVPLVATCRPGSIDEPARVRTLLLAVDAGAAYVDVEVETADGPAREVIAAARARGCKVIVSFHDYERTPTAAELEAVIARCVAAGADLVKVACLVQSPRDGARLLGLLDRPQPMVVAGMGAAGRIVRVAAPLLGSVFTFASAHDGAETAPGQLPRTTLERLYAQLGVEP